MISVLCVDDDSAYLEVMRSYIEEPGALTVTTALSVPEALKAMETNRFDAVVADYLMPGMDGIEFLRAIRAAKPGLPFILFTGKGREEIIIEAFNSGADFYLQKNGKPEIQFPQLKDMIFRAVKIGVVREEYHDSETRYRRLFETAQDGILILNGESGEITDVNPFLLTLLGYTHDEMLGKKLWEIGFIRDRTLAKQAAADLKTTGYIRYEDLPLETKDGRAIEVEFVSNVYSVENQKVIQCNIRDITERKQAEAALRESEQRYRTLAEASPDQIFIDGRDNTIQYVNTAALKLFHLSYDQVVGKPRNALFPPEIADAQGLTLKKVFETGESIRKEEMIQFGTKELWIDTNLVPLKDESGIVTSVLGIARDITERKRAEEAMRSFSDDLERKVIERTSDLGDVNMKLLTEINIRLDAEKQLTKSVGEKEVLLREVHHRVKNNLQIIISLLNLQSRNITDETTLLAFRESQNRVRAMALVHEKLYQSADLEKIDLDNYIRFLGNNLFQFFGVKGTGITLAMDIRNVFLAIDTAIPLGLIINELISNSLKYAFPDGRKGEISVAINRQDHTLTVMFKDNGVGIPKDFDWRNATSLGLRLVITLVEQLDGTVELDRTAGTAFAIVVKEKE